MLLYNMYLLKDAVHFKISGNDLLKTVYANKRLHKVIGTSFILLW